MLQRNILHHTVLHCITLYYIILRYAILYYPVLYHAILQYIFKVIWASCSWRLDKHARDVLPWTAWQRFKESSSWFDLWWKLWSWDCAMSLTRLWDLGIVGTHAGGIAAYWPQPKNLQKHMRRPQSPEWLASVASTLIPQFPNSVFHVQQENRTITFENRGCVSFHFISTRD